MGAVSRAMSGKNRPTILYGGSVKTHIGHTEAAAGLAGMVKCVLAMERGIVLPQLNFGGADAWFKVDDVVIPTAPLQWPECVTRRCSVNSFGFGGTNAHVILDDATAYRRRPLISNDSSTAADDDTARVFVLSSPEKDAILRQSEAYADYVEARGTTESLGDLAYTLSERRSKFQWRCAVVAASVEELASRWRDQKDLEPVKAETGVNIAYVFTGQGAQWHAMGRQLVSFDAFASSIRQSAACLTALGCPWDAWTELMTRDESESNVYKAGFSQPLCIVLQMALVDLLDHWGVRPSAVVGHSSGEVAAAYAAGALSRESCLHVAYQRGVFSEEAKLRSPGGSMMVVRLSAQEVQPYLLALPRTPVTVGCVNSPSSVTLTGNRDSLGQIRTTLCKEGILCRLLQVENAYHGKQMLSVSDDYRKAIISHVMPVDNPSVAFFSTVLGRQVSTAKLTADYWVDNMCSTVEFVSALDDMVYVDAEKRRLRSKSTAINTLIEIGPHGALGGPIKQFKQARGGLDGLDYFSILVRGEDASSTALTAAASLWMKGASIQLSKLNRSSEPATCLVDLPSYRWNHSTSYWHETRISKNERSPLFARHDLIGSQLPSQNPLQPVWRNYLRLSEVPWLKHHQVNGEVVLPGAGMICAVVEALRQHTASEKDHGGVSGFELRDVSITQPLLIPDNDIGVETYLHLQPRSQVGNEFVEHASGLAQVQRTMETTEVDGGKELTEEISSYKEKWIREHPACTDRVSLSGHFNFCKDQGVSLGSTFTGLSKIRRNGTSVSFEVKIPDSGSVMPESCESGYLLHPATLDATFQSSLVAIPRMDQVPDQAWVPTAVDSIRISSGIASGRGNVLYGLCEASLVSPRDMSVSIMVGDGSFDTLPSLIVEGLTMKGLGPTRGSAVEESRKNKIYALPVWKPDLELVESSDLRKLVDRKLTDGLDMDSFCLEGCNLVADLCRISLPKIGPRMESLPAHLQKYVGWLKSRCGADEEGDFAPSITTCHADANGQKEEDEESLVLKRLEEFSIKYPVDGGLLHHVFDSLDAVFAQETVPIAMLMASEHYQRYYQHYYGATVATQIFRDWFDLKAHKKPNLRVIEVGAGTAATTLPVLQQLRNDGGTTPRFSKWTFTDISPGWFENAMKLLADWKQRVDYKVLDIENDPTDQGFEPESYDVVLAVNVLHATKSLQQTLENCKRLLKPGGNLVLGEITNRDDISPFIVGVLPGWWAFEDGRENGPLLLRHEWDEALKEAGFSGTDMALSDNGDGEAHRISVLVSTKPYQRGGDSVENVVVVTPDDGCSEIIERLASQIRCKLRLPHVNVVIEGFGKSTSTGTLGDSTVVVSLLEYESPFLEGMTQDRFEKLQHLLLRNKEVLWITRSDLVDGPGHPSNRIVSGLLRSLKAEDGSYRPHELHFSRPMDEVDSAASVICHRINDIWRARLTGLDEEDTAEQNGLFVIPRYMPEPALNSSLARAVKADVVSPETASLFQHHRPLKLDIRQPGMLDSLYFVDDEAVSQPTLVDEDEVLIEVKACGLNFKDVLMAAGELRLSSFGSEAAGVVRRVGSKVTTFSPGDRVLQMAPCSMATYTRTHQANVHAIPNGVSFEEAASVPVAFSTAYHSLIDVARLKKGETVLIHSAAGGLGQALIQIANFLEADIFCTVGSLSKKQAVTALGVPPDHVFSSRDLSFHTGVKRMTLGRGVDVIVNSLAGEALRKSWMCLAPYGRFIEVGKKETAGGAGLEMRPFYRNALFAGVDLEPIVSDPDRASHLLSRVFGLFESGVVDYIRPIVTYDMSDVESAFREMQRGTHIGKIVLRITPESQAPVMPPKPATLRLKPDATYVLVGGFGGLGRAQALFMAEHGARHLVFVSRSGSARQEAKDLIVTLAEKHGVDARVYAADVADEEQLRAVMDDVALTMPPIRGVIQGAMVLEYSVFCNMNHRQWVTTTLPKIQGSWNLHRLLPDKLDFFVLLSSLSAVAGSVSQANYAAGNTFQDALAHYRRFKGLAAQSINLGAFQDIGYMHEHREFAFRMNQFRFTALDQGHFFHILQHVLASTADDKNLLPCQLLTGAGSGGIVQAAKKTDPDARLPWLQDLASFSYLLELDAQDESETEAVEVTDSQRLIRQLGRCRLMDEANDTVQLILLSKISSIVSVPESDIDTAKPIHTYGVDSLVAVELRKWLAVELKSDVGIFELTSNVPISHLCKKIAGKSKLISMK
ncbi:hypothetical protein CP532_5236 [Ophiocordyceps camponoti-leonardi (nom. inval.)]|nr:hypothetical protein CP532_5236 [Ophiocordyceps camponoti-leonardi (nom. inval.)]